MLVQSTKKDIDEGYVPHSMVTLTVLHHVDWCECVTLSA
jgi:hypothetical protein